VAIHSRIEEADAAFRDRVGFRAVRAETRPAPLRTVAAYWPETRKTSHAQRPTGAPRASLTFAR
jgi:hypothetical protein